MKFGTQARRTIKMLAEGLLSAPRTPRACFHGPRPRTCVCCWGASSTAWCGPLRGDDFLFAQGLGYNAWNVAAAHVFAE